MKEDVLEQVVDDYLRSLGFFTQANVRYRPSPTHPDYVAQQDSGWSDIDVVGYAPTRYGADRVWVISCKSWQQGLDPGRRLDQLRAGKEVNVHREVWIPKWGQALCDTVEQLTGQRAFRFFTAVTKLRGDADRWSAWNDDEQIQACLEGNPVSFLQLQDMWQRTLSTSTTTLAGSTMGRLAQMLLAAGQVTAQAPEPEAWRDEDGPESWPSLGGMWLPPPPVATCAGISNYGHTLNGYQYADKHYGVEPSPEGLERLLLSSPAALGERSFEVLRLQQFRMVRMWHHVGLLPEVMGADEEVQEAMRLHAEIQRAWVQRRFDRSDVPEQPRLPPDDSVYSVPDWVVALKASAAGQLSAVQGVFHADTEQFMGLIRSDNLGLYVQTPDGWVQVPDDDDRYEGAEWIPLTQQGLGVVQDVLASGATPTRQQALAARPSGQEQGAEIGPAAAAGSVQERPQLICRRGLHVGAILLLAERQMQRAGSPDGDLAALKAKVRASKSRAEAVAAVREYVDLYLR